MFGNQKKKKRASRREVLLESGKETLIRGAKDTLDRFAGGGLPRL